MGSVHGRGACVAGEHVLWGACMAGGMHGRGHAWQGACVVMGMHGMGAYLAWCVHGGGACVSGGHAWQGDMHGRGHACHTCPLADTTR